MKPLPPSPRIRPEHPGEIAGAGRLRWLACGAAGAGASTLIRRLLRETGEPDPSDGSSGLAEYGFETNRRRFVVSDTPIDEHVIRTLATGAPVADLAVIVVDATMGIDTPTRRLAFIASLFGIRHMVLAVNKMDLVDYDRAVLERIVADDRTLNVGKDFQTFAVVPVSAYFGDNLARRGDRLGWYEGPTLLEHLETVAPGPDPSAQPFRMPVRRVGPPTSTPRLQSGTLASGSIRAGDAIVVAGSGRTSRIASIHGEDGARDHAVAGEAVTLTLADAIDVSPGDVLAGAKQGPEVADQFAAHVAWMRPEPLMSGRTYLFALGEKTVPGTFTEIKHEIDVDTRQHLAAKQIGAGAVALVNLSLGESIAFDPYREVAATGGFVVLDRMTRQVLGAGTIEFALRRATNIRPQPVDLDKATRSQAMGQRPVVLWFTGLSGAGKSTVANLVEKRLFALGKHTYLLDGDNVRQRLNRDLGFTDADRVENIRRIAEVARLFVDAGLIVLASFISPFRSERLMARELLAPGEFVEIFVDVPLSVAEDRDPKGLYKRARSGGIKNFTGIDSPYEPPLEPELHLAADEASAEDLADRVVRYLLERGL